MVRFCLPIIGAALLTACASAAPEKQALLLVQCGPATGVLKSGPLSTAAYGPSQVRVSQEGPRTILSFGEAGGPQDDYIIDQANPSRCIITAQSR